MKKFRIAFALVLAVVTVFAGCSVSSAAPSGEPIYLVQVVGLTGERATFGDYARKGTEMWVQQVNAAGGILGRPVEVLFEDEGNSEQTSMNAISKVLAERRACGIVHSTQSAYTLAVSPMVRDAKIPYLTTGTAMSVLQLENPYVWMPRADDSYQGIAMANLGVELGMKNPVVVSTADTYGIGLRDCVIDQLKVHGIEPALVISFNVGEKQYASYLSQIDNSGADGIIACAQQQETSIFMVQAQSYEFQFPRVTAVGGVTAYVLDAARDAVNGWYGVTDFTTTIQAPVGKKFVDDYRAMYNSEPDLQCANSYDFLNIFKYAIEKAGSTDPEAINKAISEMKDLEGVESRRTANGNDHSLAASLYVVQVKDQKLEQISTIDIK